MYAFIEGKVCEKAGGVLVLEAGGVGYLLSCSMNTIQDAPAMGEVMRCYTWLSVREDAMELFGFSTKEEKAMFMLLTSVNGVGPKSALGILGAMSLRNLQMAIVMDDVAALTKAPGIGKKTAQRITMELKDKVSTAELMDVPVNEPKKTAGSVPAQDEDAVVVALESLMALGYTADEARRALSKVKGQSDKVDELIRLALRAML